MGGLSRRGPWVVGGVSLVVATALACSGGSSAVEDPRPPPEVASVDAAPAAPPVPRDVPAPKPAPDHSISAADALTRCAAFNEDGTYTNQRMDGGVYYEDEGRWRLDGRTLTITGTSSSAVRRIDPESGEIEVLGSESPFSWKLEIARTWELDDTVHFAGRGAEGWEVRRCGGGDWAFDFSAVETGPWIDLLDGGGGEPGVAAASSALADLQPHPPHIAWVGRAANLRQGKVDVLVGRDGRALADDVAVALKSRFGVVEVAAWSEATAPVTVVVGADALTP